jgi:hypothetical protein
VSLFVKYKAPEESFGVGKLNEKGFSGTIIFLLLFEVKIIAPIIIIHNIITLENSLYLVFINF